jgi:hypothetical protein
MPRALRVACLFNIFSREADHIGFLAAPDRFVSGRRRNEDAITVDPNHDALNPSIIEGADADRVALR